MSTPKGNIEGKTCLITGATAGIGLATAQVLAARGGHMVLVGRNEEKCRTTAEQLRTEMSNPDISYLVADLSQQAEIRRLAEEVKQTYPRLDVLLNNAGAVFTSRQESADGIEMTLALNHLNYFLLTNLLLDLLIASTPARIINVASVAHESGRINFDDLQNRRGLYNGLNAYNQSKLANLLFTYELDRRLPKDSGVTVNALHPGVVASNFGQNNGFAGQIIRLILSPFAISTEAGAQTSIYLADSPDVANTSGQYFVRQKAVKSSPASYDEAAAQRLWQISEELTGLVPVSS